MMTELSAEFEKNMKDLIGEEEFLLLKASYSEEPVSALRINLLKKVPEDAADLGEIFGLEKLSFSDNGFLYSPETCPGRRPFHDAGAYYIQDPSAMIPGLLLTELLDERYGEEKDLKILDLCAAPGGKTTRIAEWMKGRGILFSNEINRGRAEILSSNVERMGIDNAIVLNESPRMLSERFAGYFDAVIVDAPCSGEGMFRKDPGAVEEWSPENVRLCAERQEEILEHAYLMLRPGGIMVYSTCTFERCENEDRILALLSGHPDMNLIDAGDIKAKIPGASDGLEGCTGAVRLWPMHFNGEGHFAAALAKSGDAERTLPFGGFEPSSSVKDKKALSVFCADSLSESAAAYILGASDRYKMFGDTLSIMPYETPSLKGLRVVRCGLKAGVFKKDRFEPDHALALFLSEDDVKNFRRVTEDEGESFVKGMTLDGEGKGWCLVSVCGYSLGWGKAAGGRIKNHYPRGLRIPG